MAFANTCLQILAVAGIADLLARLRAEPGDDDHHSPWLEPLLRSINAVAAGLRNTG